MTHHVFVRLAGFGLTVTPRAPFRMERAPEPQGAVDISYWSPEGEYFARLIPDNGGYKSKLTPVTPSLGDVVDVEAGPQHARWRLETTLYTCDWPVGYAVLSADSEASPSPFDLVGPEQQLISFQSPRRMPDVAAMCAPGQAVVNMHRGADSDWIELAYEIDGAGWRQRHEVVRLPDLQVAVSVQAPGEVAAEAMVAGGQVAQSLAPWDDEM